jgi:multidrug resistance efflux pump
MPSTETEEKEIILRTEEVNEILSKPPSWLVRWGISIIFITILLGIVLSYFIEYPDTLSAKATITTLNPAVTIVSKTDGKLSNLLVKNNQFVAANEILAVIENTGNYIDVLQLETDLIELSTQIKLTDSLPMYKFFDTLKLGDLTTSYLMFLKSYKDLKLFSEINLQQQEISILNKELKQYDLLLSNYQKQANIYNQQFALIENDYSRDLDLYTKKAISLREFEGKKKELLAAQSVKENHSIAVTNTKITINNLEKNVLQLKIQYIDQSSKLKLDINQNIKNLSAQILIWKQKYLLESPIDGKISFFNVWAVNQNIKNTDNVFNVVPQRQQQLIAKLVLPSFNSGKVKINQQVNIRLDNYPYNEYGMVNGLVKNISLVSKDNNYAVDVALPQGLKTSYNKKLEYKEEMTGLGDIVTDNLSLLDRLFMKFREIIKK